jgi:antitoxin VapB
MAQNRRKLRFFRNGRISAKREIPMPDWLTFRPRPYILEGGKGAALMETARVFKTEGAQAVRLPQSCQFAENEVFVSRVGNAVILTPKSNPWGAMLESLDLFTPDFMSEESGDSPAGERNAP